MRGWLISLEQGPQGRQRLVLEIQGDYREQFDRLRGGLLDIQINRAIPPRSLSANKYFHALVGKIAAEIFGDFDQIKRDLVVDYGTPCTDRQGASIVVDLPANANPQRYYSYTRPIGRRRKNGREYVSYLLYKRTSEMNSSEMSRLIDGAVWEARELGIDIPP